MLALIIVAGGLYSLAKKRDMNAILWGVLGVVAWFGGQFIGVGLLGQGAYYDEGQALAYSLGGAIGASVLAFVALEIVYRNQQNNTLDSSDEIMDDTSIDDL